MNKNLVKEILFKKFSLFKIEVTNFDKLKLCKKSVGINVSILFLFNFFINLKIFLDFLKLKKVTEIIFLQII